MRELISRHRRVERRALAETRDETLPPEGFRIAVGGDGAVRIAAADERGLRYARRALAEWESRGLEAGERTEYPDFALRGLIEGFYGRPYTWAERRAVLEFLDECRMNAYFYAPKDDPFHRQKWREAYPETTLAEIAALGRAARERHVDFYYCISPGGDFRFADEGDYRALKTKLAAVRDAGIENFALLLDDIDPALTAADAAVFASAGEAHARLIDYCAAEIPARQPWLFCPTDYMQNFDTPYRAAFRAAAKEHFRVFWTGYNTVAEAVSARDGEIVKGCFGRDLVLWDNYPVNDFEPGRRLYLGAARNRSARLGETHAGYVVNPMPQWRASRFALAAAAEYCWNAAGYDPDRAEEEACRRLVPDAPEAARLVVERNRSLGMREAPPLLEAMRAGDWPWLDGYYAASEAAARRLAAALAPEEATELGALTDYLIAEAAFYRDLRAGRADRAAALALTRFPWRAQDQAVLAYYNELHPGEPVPLETERPVWWRSEGGEI